MQGYVNAGIFILGVTFILWSFFRESQLEKICETKTLQYLSNIKSDVNNTKITGIANGSAIYECDLKYKAVIKLAEQLNKDCTSYEIKLKAIEKYCKMLNRKLNDTQLKLASKTVEVNIEYNEPKGKGVGALIK